MILQEPEETPYDWRWSIFKIPVRVHPFFWLIVILLGFNAMQSGAGAKNLAIIFAWILAVFISIMVHELGHALTGIHYGSRRVSIVLHGFGGLAIGATGRNRKQRMLVVAMGPAAGLILYGLVYALFLGLLAWIEHDGPAWLTNEFLAYFFSFMLWINLWWSLLNLLPIYPLDGGQLCFEFLSAKRPRDGVQLTFKIGMAVGILAALYFLSVQMLFAGFLFGYLAYINYQYMNSMGSGGGRGQWR